LARYLHDVELVPVTSLEEAIQEIEQVPAQALLINAASVSENLLLIEKEIALPFGLPAIVCSVPGLRVAADNLGVADYLVKPISRDALLAVLDHLPMAGKTILVVDDEPDALRLFRRMLASAQRDYRVLRATNGRQAQHILREQQPDVVLVDLMMPDMDGFQLIAEMHQNPAWRDIPIVVISAQDPSGQPIVSKL
jgi:CheY-like chemotaxis protein